MGRGLKISASTSSVSLSSHSSAPPHLLRFPSSSSCAAAGAQLLALPSVHPGSLRSGRGRAALPSSRPPSTYVQRRPRRSSSHSDGPRHRRRRPRQEEHGPHRRPAPSCSHAAVRPSFLCLLFSFSFRSGRLLTLSLILILIFVGADGHDHLTVSEEDALLRGGKQPQIEEDGTGREHGHGLQIEEDGTGQAQAWERVLWPCSGSSSPSVTLTTTATSSTTPTSSSVSAYAPPAQSSQAGGREILDLRKKRREIIFRKSLVKNKVISAPYHVAEEKLLTIFRHLWEGEELKMVTYIDWKPNR
ncbi:uncharacterized protein LOC125516502 [Triticum urartu]|uniref:uncharacterized protein LOC125516502 n=1 Tax=Triticum urartu TaxID=4572 RepID=UPI002043A305|nr:uncharacterized protein LOC125516502 [Triticum urartu]